MNLIHAAEKLRIWVIERAVRPALVKTGTYLLKKAGMPVEKQQKPPEPVHRIGWKEKALSDFDLWLDDMPDELPKPKTVETESCDLYTLLVEFINLRQEIHIQNREQHNTLKTQQSLIEDHREIARLFEKCTQQLEKLEENIRRNCEKRMVVPFLDIRDAIIRGLTAARQVKQTRGILKKTPKGIEGIVEGYEMALRRFDRSLSHAGIEPIDAVGLPFDPSNMEALGKKNETDTAPGIVVEQIRSGFIRGTEVLRTAQVVVNSRKEP
jgi:molecular chaperone GrpE (heat shock protein)